MPPDFLRYGIFAELVEEGDRQAAKGRGDAHDDGRTSEQWVACAETLVGRLREAHDQGLLPIGSPIGV